MLARFSFLILLSWVLLWGCKPLDERLDPNPGKGLRFSADTVLFDTVFTEQKTITLRLRVFNDNSGTVTLQSVALEKGAGSPFSFLLNGRKGPVQNLEILGNDSAYVLVSGTLPASRVDTPLVYEDHILFSVKGRAEQQSVLVLAKGQDAYYFNGRALGKDTTFTKEKPIVIFNSFLVDSGRTLTIEEGTRIHLYQGSYFFVQGTLKVNGSCAKPVRFTGTRLEPYYKQVPGQWGYIAFLGGSHGSKISHAIIENGLRGIQLDTPGTRLAGIDLEIDNTMIRNTSDIGLYGFGAQIVGYNLVVADCGSSYVVGQEGGDYSFAHCTLAQSGNNPFNRKNPLMYFSDSFQQDVNSPVYVGQAPTVRLYNSLLSGSLNEEFTLAKPYGTNNAIDTLLIQNNFFFGRRNANVPKSNLFSTTAQAFQAPSFYDFRPDSAATGKTIQGGRQISDFAYLVPFTNIASGLYTDFLCVARDANTPDIGAYQKKR